MATVNDHITTIANAAITAANEEMRALKLDCAIVVVVRPTTSLAGLPMRVASNIVGDRGNLMRVLDEGRSAVVNATRSSVVQPEAKS